MFPSVIDSADPSALELGVRFVSTINAFVTGIRFYKAAANVGTHTGRIWSSGGALLGTVVFSDESATGWQQAMFTSPIAVKAGVPYVASYTAPQGHYSYDTNYFESAYDLPPIGAPANGDGGPNGVFSTSPGTFPTRTFGASNYWVDPILDTDDQRPPTVVDASPGVNVSQVGVTTSVAATFSESVIASSIVMDLAGPSGTVAGVVSYDDSVLTATFVPDEPLEPLTTYTATVSAAVDTVGSSLVTPKSWTFTTVGAPGTVPTSIWTGDDVPATLAAADPNAVELGLKFRSSSDGFVTGLRFYKGEGNGGTHVGRLWTAAGDLLAAVTFDNESNQGWQEASFVEPVAVKAGDVLVASYLAPEGRYAVSGGHLNGSSISRGPLQAIDGTTVGGNGVFRYGAGGGFPTSSYGNSNYWVDVVLTVPPSTLPPSVVTSTPAPDLLAVTRNASISAGFEDAIDVATASFVVSDSAGQPVAGSTSYLPETRTLVFTPGGPLESGVTYTASVSAASSTGVAMETPHSWSFTTATNVGELPATLWDTSAEPAIAAADDASSIELGMKFRADADGTILAIRFFKGAGNIGPHLGHLWSESGELLGTAVFSNESSSGWQQAFFPTPVAISAGVTYVASYLAPAGRYAVTLGGLADAVDRLPLHTLANSSSNGNGVYAYGAGSFPQNSYQGSNYWVDVVFTDTTGPAVVSRFPAANAVGVAVTTSIGASFSEAIDPASFAIELRDAQGGLVSGTSGYDASTKTVSIDPSSDLAPASVFTASVSGARDLAGNAMSGTTSWAFTTAGAGTVNLFGLAMPSIPSADDQSAVELGMRFRTTVDGKVHGVRFYKGAANTGLHLGRLWTPDGTLLASVEFVGETATGWQYAAFATPVQIPANTDHVVSYFAPSGGYAAAGGFFGSGDVINGPIIGLGNSGETPNGLYRYGGGGGFPTSTYGAGNYWVDVEFEPNSG